MSTTVSPETKLLRTLSKIQYRSTNGSSLKCKNCHRKVTNQQIHDIRNKNDKNK
ncbi:MAG: hypothetical protein Q8897_01970 [Sweet potato little leaf phytoplasma]|uniref:hypothetical protein n=1 Tax=16SrII (Peanut WB group) TaxID=85621 RepID=UPI0003A7CDCA|nr:MULTISPECIES: hypothetical protein [16SrII (Peanut WB group)]MDV3197789.1 hypothetical protein [Candidatus Phytoplasma australasiaticum]QLL36878.1 hypothetical protein EPWB_v2c2750 ['Echinacea purpurea' witches'-broom phytoplasma]WEX20257.1 MAG: hypothetical protein TB2022_1500 [Candidatus Phytoplasma aurantifolia]MDV3140044.1 hypothetical protein [Sweet potato little leaf phytoplasma]MDV3140928.1 hypothetical protein [Sweet potato little leaf phytoplasma]